MRARRSVWPIYGSCFYCRSARLFGCRDQHDTVSACLFRSIERGICTCKKLLLVVALAQTGDTETGGHKPCDREVRRSNRLSNFFSDSQRLLLIGLRENDQKFFPAPSPDGICLTDTVLQDSRDENQNRITNSVTKFIIDLLDVIDIEHDEREIGLVAFGTINFLLNDRIEFGAVVNLSQLVGDGQNIQLLIRFFQCGRIFLHVGMCLLPSANRTHQLHRQHGKTEREEQGKRDLKSHLLAPAL